MTESAVVIDGTLYRAFHENGAVNAIDRLVPYGQLNDIVTYRAIQLWSPDKPAPLPDSREYQAVRQLNLFFPYDPTIKTSGLELPPLDIAAIISELLTHVRNDYKLAWSTVGDQLNDLFPAGNVVHWRSARALLPWARKHLNRGDGMGYRPSAEALMTFLEAAITAGSPTFDPDAQLRTIPI
jgi:hypothetical protein